MVVFPMRTRAYRDQMRALIRQNEEGARKPITWELFRLTESEPEAFTEA